MPDRRTRLCGLVIALLAGTSFTTGMAHAQTDASSVTPAPAEPDAIVVTAQRRSELSRDVPISVTTLSAQQLTVANVQQLADTAKLTPGLRFDTQGPASQPTIRGVGTAITTSGGGPNVGTYVDGFFQPNTYTSNFDLLNVQSIQVLKGPQGTLFGRNTTGGAILVTTADPSTDPSAQFKATYARFNSVILQGYGTFGLTDRIALDVEGLYRRGDGFQHDLSGTRRHIGRYEDWSIRAGAKFQITDDVSLLVRYTHVDNDDPTSQLVNTFIDRTGDAGFFDKISPAARAIYGRTSSKGLPLSYYYAPATTVATRPDDILLNPPVSFRAKTDSIQGTIKADLGFADLTSYTEYRRDHTPYFGDLDATALPIFNILVDVHSQNFSQELLLTSKPGTRLQWTAGATYFQFRDTWDVSASFGLAPFIPFGGSSTNTKSIAAFADLTYELSDKLFLTAGARFSHDTVGDAYFRTHVGTTSYVGPNGETVPFTGAPETPIPVGDLKNNALTPRVVLRYKPDQDSSVYASFTRGYKAGILNVGGLSQQRIKPEKINAFELGYKYERSAFSVDLAGFYYDYKNLQVSSYQDGAAQIRNAASSRIYGAEAQARYRFSDAFNVTGGVAWTHARYRSFKNAPFYTYCDPTVGATNGLFCGALGPGAIVQTSTDASGYKMQRSPEFSGNIGASYAVPLADGRLTFSGNVYATSSFYFDPEQQFKQRGYALVSLRAEWVDPSKRYTIAVFGDNVTDKRYQTQVLFTTVGTGAEWNSPATYGAQLTAKF